MPVCSEFEYKRHGTCSFLINFDVVTGRVFSPSSGPTRTEADFLGHVQPTVASDPTATQCHFVADNLEIHCSETLVRYVAERAGITDDLGVKYVRGVLRSRASRAAFLADPTPRSWAARAQKEKASAFTRRPSGGGLAPGFLWIANGSLALELGLAREQPL